MSRDPKLDLQNAQQMRWAQINKITNDGTTLPTDPKEVAMLAGLLRDVDGSATAVIKLGIEEKAVNVASEVANNVRDIIRSFGGDPFRTGNVIEGQASRVTSLMEGVVLPDVQVLPGHDYQGTEELNYDDFVSDTPAP